MVCRTWSQPDANHFRGLCTNSFYPEVGSNAKSCVVCATPVQIGGSCPDCDEDPAKSYSVALTQSVGAQTSGCCSDYIREFVVHQVSACRWESDEIERAAQAMNFGPALPVECNDQNCSRPRVVLLSAKVFFPTRTRWTIQVNWRTMSTAGFPGFLTKNTAQSVGFASRVDCFEPVNTVPTTGFGDGVEGPPANYQSTPCGVTEWQLYGHVRPLG